MRKFVVHKKTGYKITNPSKPITIRDNRGLIFYTTETLTPKIKEFNLPPFGFFYIEDGNSIEELKEPVKYNYAKLPVLIRRFKSPFDFKIVWGINPNKCTVKWNDKIILFDSSFKEKPLPQVFFILYHEYAHAFTNNESLADKISGNYMKAQGFNPEQIGAASIYALSSRQIERKKDLVNSLIASQ